MEKEKVFKVGDKITYKSINDCTHYNGGKNSYYYGGMNKEGHVGKILRYDEYIEQKQCWRIEVSNSEGSYSMLESEFENYNIQLKPQDLFPIY